MSKSILTFFAVMSISSSLQAQITTYISDAVGQNNIANRAIVDTQDDPWRAAVGAAVSCPAGQSLVIEEGDITTAGLPEVLNSTMGTSVNISLQNMTNAGVGTTHTSQGTASGAGNTNMQDNSPKPASLSGGAIYNENGGSSATPNGFLFTFSPAVDNFGGWFGDLETRTEPRDDGFACSPSSGTTAVLRLIDTMGNVTNIDILPNASTDQALCGGPVNNSYVGCGNKQTRWIGFTSSIDIAQMVVIVGDDDTTCSGSNTADAGTEHLSFMGATHAECQSVLPVELVGLDSKPSANGVEISWSTLSETNNAGFEVQHASIGREFEAIGFVEGMGNSNTEHSYSFDFEVDEPGQHSFRLKQLDFNGSSSHSPVVETHIDLSSVYFVEQAYPNPFSDNAKFKLAVAEEQNIRVSLFDQLGKEVKVIFEGPVVSNQISLFEINRDGLSSGIYFYRVQGRTFQSDGMVTILR